MILDTTLREGMQRFGLRLGLEERWNLLVGLSQAGVAEAEIGVCGRDPSVDILADRARTHGLGIRTSVWCPLLDTSLEHAARIRPDIVSLSIPTSEAHVKKRLGLDMDALHARLRDFVAKAHDLGLMHLSLGLEDASRTHHSVLQNLAALAQDLGIRRIRLADTVGVLEPTACAAMVRKVRKACRIDIGFHGHNDFGMATANALTALDAGADCVDATLLGIGERSGIAATEELGAFLHLRRRAPLEPGLLADLARMLAREGELTLQGWKPIVGESLFHAESGMHVQGILVDPTLYEPFDPALVGSSRKLGLGRQAGRSSVRRTLSQLGIETDAELATVLVRAEAERQGHPLEESEIRSLFAPTAIRA